MLRDHDRDREPISIHALREEGDLILSVLPISNKISIHALREEGDRLNTTWFLYYGRFLSTPSARRATPAVG